ncbi:MAG: N-6 DNA methylase [Brachymonas sp.]|nr:N-6 DNA methylase [Brachymonas sp.]
MLAKKRALTTNELRKRLTAFAHQWAAAAREEADEKLFTADFLRCFDIEPHQYLREYAVKKQDGSTGYMDGFIPGKLIIEGKSLGKDLKKACQQAESYRWACPQHQQPRYVLLHDFGRFALFDLGQDSQHSCTLADLPRHADWFRFLIDDAPPVITEETEADRRAAEQMAELHEALLRSRFAGRDLEIFLTRLLFCLFADDTEIFGDNGVFRRLVEATRADGKDLGPQLAELFEVLNTPEGERSLHLDEDLAAFAYVNGQLFAERTRIPAFDSALRQLLLQCVQLDWSAISPAIFGAMFQGVLEQHQPDQSRTASRRELGAHYTSERNILRAINPLFMDDLRAELAAARNSKTRLQALYDKLPAIRVLDPACGCGNFLVIAYRELRRLEMDVIERLFGWGRQIGGTDRVDNLSRVRVNQFHGIEIDPSAAHIAQVAMWITDHQMNQEAAARFGTTRPSIPLTHSAAIHEGNALRTDWAAVLPPAQCSFVVGNPPFVGAKYQSTGQRADAAHVMHGIPNSGLLDYVACWHVKAAGYMQANPAMRTALVSTNSICQGEQVGVLWPHMLAQGLHLQFAHRTFQWSNEGRGVAAVHCIIVGYGSQPAAQPVIYDYSANIKAAEGQRLPVKRINPYLVDAPDVLLARRSKPLCDVPEISFGNQPIDGGHLILQPSEAKELKRRYPGLRPYVRRFLGADEFINGEDRYCLWLKDAPPDLLREIPEVKERLAQVKAFRLSSSRKATNELAATPAQFAFVSHQETCHLVVPSVSSERRHFIPIGFLGPNEIVSNLCLAAYDVDQYHFGMLCSTMHNAWMRTVAGRLKSDYRYSAKIVYNNYPWPQQATDKQRMAIAAAAQSVLDARALYPGATLADLYDPLTMPAELAKAHAALDKAVDAAYSYKGGKDDASRVAFLFKLYQQLGAPTDVPATAPRRRARAASPAPQGGGRA